MVCKKCYEDYTIRAGRLLAKEGKIVPFTAWAKEEIQTKLQEVEKKFNETQKKYEDLKKEVNEEAYKEIIATLKGKRIEKNILKVALKEKREKIWNEKGGNKIYWELKTSEKKYNFLKTLFEELKEKTNREKTE